MSRSGSEPFAELLKRRWMARSYLPDPIDHATIERIVGTVRRAPSAGFSQGHSLVVVAEPETRQELARLAGEEQYAAMGLPPWISVAPVRVVVGVCEESYHERYRRDDKLVDGGEITWPAPRRAGHSTPPEPDGRQVRFSYDYSGRPREARPPDLEDVQERLPSLRRPEARLARGGVQGARQLLS